MEICRGRRFFEGGGWVTLRANFRWKGATPTNHRRCQKTRVIALSCGVKISAVHCLILSQNMQVTDRRTQLRQLIPHWHSCSRGNKWWIYTYLKSFYCTRCQQRTHLARVSAHYFMICNNVDEFVARVSLFMVFEMCPWHWLKSVYVSVACILLWHVCLRQDRDRKHFQELMKQKVKQRKAELDGLYRGQSKEVKQQRRAELEAEFAKKAS